MYFPGFASGINTTAGAPTVEILEAIDDRGPKAGLYARAGVHDYWIVNLVDRVLEVHREPAASPDVPSAWSYRAVTSLGPGASVAPLARPGVLIEVAALLPRAAYAR